MQLKLFFLVVLLFGDQEVFGRPSGSEPVQILRYENTLAEDNGYKFDFLTSDGQKREETGMLVNGGQELVVRGSYSFTGTDNKQYLVNYVADKNGFHPKLEVVPLPPKKHLPPTTFIYNDNSEIRPDALKALLGK